MGRKDQMFHMKSESEEIRKVVPEYSHSHMGKEKGVYWPVGKSRVLYEKGYRTEDNKAKLQAFSEAPMYLSYLSNDYKL